MAGGLGALTAAVVCLAGAGAPWLVAVALGPGYADAVAPFRLLLLSTGIAVATLWATPAMLASGQPRAATAAATAGAASLALLLPALISAGGATGAGWARVGGGLAYLAVVLWWLARVGRDAPCAARSQNTGPARLTG
jgi:O-antigen/teichoic acid export membrane protein